MHFIFHEELGYHFLYFATRIQTIVCIHHLFYRNYYTSYCLCAGLVQLQLIPQVHYIIRNPIKIHMPYIQSKYVKNIVVNGSSSQTDS